jgi:uncharacterized protein YbjT (DUF2867 family)
MKVILFGATGMIGQGVLRECLLDADVEVVLSIGRSACGVRDGKLREIVRADLFHYSDVEADLTGFDACFYCLGVTSAGMSEADYTRLTYDLTMAAAETLSRLNLRMTFVFVSGGGADSSEKGRTMWARVKGKTENAILRLPFKAACVFRPAAIQALHGERSKTASYRILYSVMKPLIPLIRSLFPGAVITTEEIGRAMIRVAKFGPPKAILESADIGAFGRGSVPLQN